MTDLTQKYQGSIAAGRALEGGVWALALALAGDVKENGGTAKEATQALKEAGITSTSGSPYGENWVKHLVQVGTWALEAPSSIRNYPARRVIAAGQKHDWDAEAMLFTLQAGGTSHQISETSPLGKPEREKVRQEIDRLPAKDRAALATELVSQAEVREAILRSEPMAREQHIVLGGEIAKESKERSERVIKTTFPTHAASDAADEVSLAARHLANALAEIVQWKVTEADDRLNRLGSAMERVERYVDEINDTVGRVART